MVNICCLSACPSVHQSISLLPSSSCISGSFSISFTVTVHAATDIVAYRRHNRRCFQNTKKFAHFWTSLQIIHIRHKRLLSFGSFLCTARLIGKFMSGLLCVVWRKQEKCITVSALQSVGYVFVQTVQLSPLHKALYFSIIIIIICHETMNNMFDSIHWTVVIYQMLYISIEDI